MNVWFDLLLTAVCIWGSTFFYRKFRLISKGTYVALLIFIFLSVFSGRVLGIYALIPYWDKVLHFLSGFLLVLVGKDLLFKLGKAPSRLFYLLFLLFFALSGAMLWEIYEFTLDALLGTNSQNASLSDTMWDMIAGSCGTLLSILFSSKKHTS